MTLADICYTAGVEDEPIQQLAMAVDELNANIDLVRRVLDEIRDELQWGVRNDRIRILSLATGPQADDTRLNALDDSIVCAHCDDGTTVAEAIQEGWVPERITHAPDLLQANYVGECPRCAALLDAPPRTDTTQRKLFDDVES